MFLTNKTVPSSRADDARGCSGGVAVNGRGQDAADAAVELVVVGKTNRVASLPPALVAPERAAHIAFGVGTVEAREAVAACRRTCSRRTRHQTYGGNVVEGPGLVMKRRMKRRTDTSKNRPHHTGTDRLEWGGVPTLDQKFIKVAGTQNTIQSAFSSIVHSIVLLKLRRAT